MTTLANAVDGLDVKKLDYQVASQYRWLLERLRQLVKEDVERDCDESFYLQVVLDFVHGFPHELVERADSAGDLIRRLTTARHTAEEMIKDASLRERIIYQSSMYRSHFSELAVAQGGA